MAGEEAYRLLVATQSGGLRPFEALARRLSEKSPIEKTGFTIADRWNYHNWLKDNPDFECRGHLLIKEWDITGDLSKAPDLALLRHYEETLAQPAGLFGAIIADRRLTFGPNISFSEDYRRRFTDEELFALLINGCVAVERLFEELKPNLVIGFVAVTIVEYLVYLFAKARDIRYLNIKPARIENRMLVDGALAEPGPRHANAYNEQKKIATHSLKQAREIIASIRAAHQPKYEGTSAVSDRPARKFVRRRSLFGSPIRFLSLLQEFRASGAATDNHCSSLFNSFIYLKFINPFRANQAERKLRSKYVTPEQVEGIRYAFFPLHADPEMATLVYSRPHTDQIEALRAIAASLPADMMLVTKEHPWMVGKRNLSTYRKISEIPRVKIASPRTPARDWIAKASIVAVLTSSVALEAAVRRKPVVTLGNTAVNLLPDTMVSRCRDWTRMPQDIMNLLTHHWHDEVALEYFVAASLGTSVPVNWYGELLGRGGGSNADTSGFDKNIDKLASYVLDVLASPWPSEPVQGACDW